MRRLRASYYYLFFKKDFCLVCFVAVLLSYSPFKQKSSHARHFSGGDFSFQERFLKRFWNSENCDSVDLQPVTSHSSAHSPGHPHASLNYTFYAFALIFVLFFFFFFLNYDINVYILGSLAFHGTFLFDCNDTLQKLRLFCTSGTQFCKDLCVCHVYFGCFFSDGCRRVPVALVSASLMLLLSPILRTHKKLVSRSGSALYLTFPHVFSVFCISV